MAALLLLFLALLSGRAEAQSNGEVRIADTATGRIEMYHNGSWRGVCDDSWDAAEARVVCRQLGYSDGSAVTRIQGGNNNFVLDDLDCDGEEDNLLECPHIGVGIHNCQSNEHAGVTCSTTASADAPQLTATANGRNQIDLTWTDPNLSPEVTDVTTGYDLQVSDGTANWSDLKTDFTDSDTSYSHTGLSPGTTKHYRIRARDSGGDGSWSIAKSATTDATPGMPENFVAREGNANAVLGWSPPSDDGGLPITKYQHRWRAEGESDWNPGQGQDGWADVPGGASARSHRVENLVNGERYTFEVRAVNEVDDGVSASATVFLGGPTPPGFSFLPGAPQNLLAEAGDGNAALKWSPPAEKGDTAITRYQHRWIAEGESDWRPGQEQDGWADVPGGASAASHVVKNLAGGRQYTFEVRAVNGAGGGAAASVTATPEGPTEPGAPGLPQNLRVQAGDGNAALGWSPPSDDGGSPITGYQHRWRAAGESDWRPGRGQEGWADVPGGAGARSHVVENLASGRQYTFEVRAVNDSGGGAAASATTTPEEPTKPGMPQNLRVQAGDGNAALGWSPPADDGGSPITRYQHRWRAEGESDWRPNRGQDGWVDVPEERARGATWWRNLAGGRQYTFEVRAVNGIGEGVADSATATPTAPARSRRMLQSWLTHFGRTAASQAMEAVGERLASSSPEPARMTLGGRSVRLDSPAQALAESGPDPGGLSPRRDDFPGRVREASMDDLLMASSFHLASVGGAGGGPGRRWSAWGRGEWTRFEHEDGDLTLDGEVSTGLLGADYERGRILAGVALSRSEGEGGYRMEDGPRGELEASLTSAYPYLRYALGERVSLWGMFGLGRGELTLIEADGAERIDADIEMSMTAFGVRGALLRPERPGGFELALKSDFLLVRMESDAAAEALPSVNANANRMRMLLEGSSEMRLRPEGKLRASAEVGLRQDMGDAEQRMGVVLGAGLRYTHTGWGLTIELSTRGLLTHEGSGHEEWGAGGSFRLSPGAGGRGLAMKLGSSWGISPGGAERLWSGRYTAGLSRNEEAADASFDAEVGYGLDGPGGGLLTPYGGFSANGSGGETYRVGGRLRLGDRASLSLEGDRRERADEAPSHGISLRGAVRW